MNAPFEVADLHYSVTWPAAEPFVIPAQVAAALTAARTMLAETSAQVEAEVMLGLPRNRGRLLLGSIVSTVTRPSLEKLASPTTRVVFIGQAGIGKSTSICLLTNLTRSDDDARAHRHRRLPARLWRRNRIRSAARRNTAISSSGISTTG